MATFHVSRMQQATLAALLWVSMAVKAQENPCQPHLTGLPMQRSIYFSKDPNDDVTELYVAGGVATTLRLPVPVDSSRTKLLGWEGRFEPLLMGGKSVVIVPLRDLAPGDRFMLLVTLEDGTELPFTVASAAAAVDGQINVYPDPEAPEAVRKELEEKRKEVRSLKAANRRQREEESSVDHALAALLANNELKMTPFKEDHSWLLREEGIEVEISVLVPKGKVANTKAAVVFKITNKDPVKPWKLQEARLTTWTTRESRPLALRTARSAIEPGATGRIAVVTDLSSFDSNKIDDRLVLELFRDGGLRQAYVELVLKDRR
ncbi:DUF2381 family protein [Hyalangium sp.]|uniref:DUF2381 family protein n=1 Tax=Hyalangium sp. TaxID=2028555 RepID=UPI002D30FF23|nr:DUF2381 family protein [Hyalangium sp.]HYI00757.1 DUF2381 family protein [Hyalangium sp.]